MFDSVKTSRPGLAAGLVLDQTDPALLSDTDLISYVQATERQVAHANALALRAVQLLADRAESAVLASARGPGSPARDRDGRLLDADGLAARAGIEEVRQALRLSLVAADNRVALARALHTGPITAVGNALRAGQVSLAHARVALEHTQDRSEAVVADMLTRALPRASSQTPGDFGKSLKRAEHAVDPIGAAARHREAVAVKTGLVHRADADGTGTISLTAAEPETEWAFSVIDTLARAELRNRLRTPACDVDNNGIPPTPPGVGHTDGAASPRPAEATVDNNGVPATPSGRGQQGGSRPSTAPTVGVGEGGVLATPAEVAAADGLHASTNGTAAVDNNGGLATPSGCGQQDGASPSAAAEERAVPATPLGTAGNGSHGSTDSDAVVDNNGVLATPSPAGARRSRPSLPALRAEVLLGLIHRAVTDPAFPTSHGKRRIDTQVVLTLDTLLGLRQDPAGINGRPVPGPIARELANASSSLRRLVTDPVGGHLLDCGDAFPVPQALAEFVLARDGECRVPHCHVKATVSDLEHAVPREQDGRSSSQNLGAMCRSDHTLKTAGHTDLVDSAADGSVVFVTVLGQRIAIPPRPVLEPGVRHQTQQVAHAPEIVPVDIPAPF